jgi:hypothetical protein
MWPVIIRFIDDNPEHNHSKQWQKWIDSGLNETRDLSTLKDITNTETLDQIYLILRNSPAINKYFEILWDHKIMYKQISPTHMEQKSTPQISSNTALINTIRTLADHDMEFCIFHKFIYEEITNWMNSSGPNRMRVAEDPKGDKWLQWKKWIFGGLKPIQPAQNIKKIMDVKDIHEYLQKVQPYQPFQEKFIIYDSDEPTSIRYSYSGCDNINSLAVKDFQHFKASFNINLPQMNARLHEFNVKIAGCEYTLKNHYAQQKSKLTEITNNI